MLQLLVPEKCVDLGDAFIATALCKQWTRVSYSSHLIRPDWKNWAHSLFFQGRPVERCVVGIKINACMASLLCTCKIYNQVFWTHRCGQIFKEHVKQGAVSTSDSWLPSQSPPINKHTPFLYLFERSWKGTKIFSKDCSAYVWMSQFMFKPLFTFDQSYAWICAS